MNENELMMRIDGKDLNISLTDLASVDPRGVDPVRGFPLTPAGLYLWRVKNASMEIAKMRKGGKDADADVEVNRLQFKFELEAVNVLSVKDRTLDPADLVGTVHFETITIFDADRHLGNVVALLTDSGFLPTATGTTWEELMNEFHGWQFVGGIKHRADRNDKDKKYADLDLQSISPDPNQPAAAPVSPPTPAPADTQAQAPAATQPAANPFANRG